MEASHQYKRMGVMDKLVKTKRSKEQQGKEAHISYLPCSAMPKEPKQSGEHQSVNDFSVNQFAIQVATPAHLFEESIEQIYKHEPQTESNLFVINNAKQNERHRQCEDALGDRCAKKRCLNFPSKCQDSDKRAYERTHATYEIPQFDMGWVNGLKVG